MSLTVSEAESILSRYAGANNTFLDRLNEVQARLMQGGGWRGTKKQILLPIYSDADGNSIVTLPRQYKTILAGAVRSSDVLCSGMPMGVRNEFAEFDGNGLGYGGLTQDFDEVPGRFALFQEWSTPMRIRLKFEVSETAGTIYLSGTLAGEDVWALNTATWEKREAIAFSGTTTVTSTKYFDAYQFAVKKPITLGRVSLYAVDDDDVETLCAVYEPTETLPRWKRYKVPTCEGVVAVSGTSTLTDGGLIVPSQFYTKAEILSMFADSGTIAVSAAGTHDLSYAAYFTRIVRVTAAAGAYTHTFTLDNSTVKNGGTLRVKLEMQAGAEILQFYDNTVLGTLLAEVDGDTSNAQYMTLVFSFGNDGAWHYEGREI